MSYADEIKLWTTDAGARWLAAKVDLLEERLAAAEKKIAECCGGEDAGRQPAPLAATAAPAESPSAKAAPAESAAKTDAESPTASTAKASSTDNSKAADSSKSRKRT